MLFVLILGVSALQDMNSQKSKSLWEVEAMYRIKINCATYVNVREVGKVSITAAFSINKFKLEGHIRNLTALK